MLMFPVPCRSLDYHKKLSTQLRITNLQHIKIEFSLSRIEKENHNGKGKEKRIYRLR